MSTVFAERTLEFFGDDGVDAGVVRIEAPVSDQRFELKWRCHCVVSWPGFEQRRVLFGVDSWEVLIATCKLAVSLVAQAADFRAGRIGVFGERLTSAKKLSDAFGVSPRQGF